MNKCSECEYRYISPDKKPCSDCSERKRPNNFKFCRREKEKPKKKLKYLGKFIRHNDNLDILQVVGYFKYEKVYLLSDHCKLKEIVLDNHWTIINQAEVEDRDAV